MRDPKQDPQPGDIIRWQGKDRVFVTLVTGRGGLGGLGDPETVSWVDVNPNGYPDSETHRVHVWQQHKGIQDGTVLFTAPPKEG